MSATSFVAHGVTVTTRDGRRIVEGVDLRVEAERTLVVVGESGAGKSQLARALCALEPPGFTVTGTVELGGRSLDLGADAHSIGRQRGAGIVWLPQDPFTSLSPTHTCAQQILAHPPASSVERQAMVAARLAEVGLPARVANARPHELSGGMRQRVAIAAALDATPKVLIADEPTTALDVTTQAEILDLLADLRERHGMTLILVTHDLALARRHGDDVLVMRGGRVVEAGPVGRVLSDPQEAYTRRLLDLEPRLDGPDPRAHADRGVDASGAAAEPAPLLTVGNLGRTFHGSGGARHVALAGVDLKVARGEAVAVVGESGSGKTTLARCIVGLEHPDTGTVHIDAPPLGPARRRGWRSWPVPPVSIVFQNPYAALNPSLTVGTTLREVLRAVGRPDEDVAHLLRSVGLPTEHARRPPADLSGGERQRVALARAIATRPCLLICDEAVSALDVSVQAQVLDLLVDLQEELGFALLFITHDLAVARSVCDRVVVMKDGRIVEDGPTSRVLHQPEHPYTQALLAAVPSARPREEST
ncbi:ABC transporter ATP-binding protein [Schaalia sp. 19OD2882]|uniref:ABC transporter ATP-binding protein n=1 Tax=Schaalia sp. 19OD2882 TaxID=2794089 RepID=UPI0020A835BE|nr:ABC transporter ATP-binding protein [Schaalia sp. 19OD2882]